MLPTLGIAGGGMYPPAWGAGGMELLEAAGTLGCIHGCCVLVLDSSYGRVLYHTIVACIPGCGVGAGAVAGGIYDTGGTAAGGALVVACVRLAKDCWAACNSARSMAVNGLEALLNGVEGVVIIYCFGIVDVTVGGSSTLTRSKTRFICSLEVQF
eukprot:scaffold37874_cov42-Cyclotella_meneghiniana.AAC.10